MKNRLLSLLVIIFITGGSHIASAQIITTIAGGGADINDGGPAINAGLSGPIGVAIDNSGNIYIGDRDHNRVRKVSKSGIITTIAGTGSGSYGGDGGPATDAKINGPYGVAVDRNGNVYIADGLNYRIRKVDTAGIITTIAGTGTAGYNGDGIAATSAEISSPGVAVDLAGNVYVTDDASNRIRRINPAGIITTVAGNGISGNSGDGSPATAAELLSPYGIALDVFGNIYVAEDRGHCIRKVSTSGYISTIAGTGLAGYSGDNGPATMAQLNRSCGIGVDPYGNVYIADVNNNRIRKIDTSGIINTIAGTGDVGFSGDGGSAILAELSAPVGVVTDGSGNVFVADFGNNRIRYITSALSVNKVDNNSERLRVFPNPNSGRFVLEVSSTDESEISVEVNNLLGETVKKINAKTNEPLEIVLDVPAGIYYLSAFIGNKKWHTSVVLNR